MKMEKQRQGIIRRTIIRMAKNILVRNGMEIKDRMVIETKGVEDKKALGASQARNQILSSIVKAQQKGPQKPVENDRERWEAMKRRMVRLPEFEGKNCFGVSNISLGKCVEFHIDNKGHLWFNTVMGKSNNVFGGMSWADTFDIEKAKSEGTLFLNFDRDSQGRIKYIDKRERKHILEPSQVFVDDPSGKLNLSKLVESYDDKTAEMERLGDIVLKYVNKTSSADSQIAEKVKELGENVNKLFKTIENMKAPYTIPDHKEEPDKKKPINRKQEEEPTIKDPGDEEEEDDEDDDG